MTITNISSGKSKKYIDDADAKLQANIDTEASARSTADTNLQSAIDAEKTNRSSADTALQANIDTVEDNSVTGVTVGSTGAVTVTKGDGTSSTPLTIPPGTSGQVLQATGTAGKVSPLTTDLGSATQPVYIAGGIPKAGTALSAGAYKGVVTSVDDSANLPTSSAVKTAIANAVTGLYSIKGSITALPTSPTVGDVYNLATDLQVSILGGTAEKVPTGSNIVYTSEGWDKLSETLDLSGYALKTEVSEGLATKQDTLTWDSLPKAGSSNPVTSAGIYTALATKQDKIIVQQVTLAMTDWTANTDGTYSATASVNDVTSAVPLIVGADKSTTDVWNDNGIKASAQAEGKITFTAESKPSASCLVNVVIIPGDGTGSISIGGGAKPYLSYGVSFDADTFATDPKGCLTYINDCAGYTPVDNSSSTALQSAEAGDWNGADALISSMYYGLFDGTELDCILDPDDLTKDINGNDVSAKIKTENVMLVIPTLYSARSKTRINLSTNPAEGRAYAHTYDGHIYKYLAIGVYEGSIVDGKLMSVSGAVPAKNITRSAFRTYAQANGDGYMIPNWHVRQLLRDLTILKGKSFNSQGVFGQGYVSGGSADVPEGLTTGLGNQLGRYAGNVGGSGDVVKDLIENPWGSKWEIIDDVLTGLNAESGTLYTDFYAGQNLKPTDEQDRMELIVSGFPVSSETGWGMGYATEIDTSDKGWGFFAGKTGSASTGLCDAHYTNPAGVRLALVGGSSTNGSAGGVSALSLNDALSHSSWGVGARPAFVFD